MSTPCQEFRMRFVDRVASSDADEHARSCADCAEWARVAEAWIDVLSRRRRAPDELEARVARDLEQPFSAESPAVRLVASLAPLPAPEELAARVFPETDTEAEAPSGTEERAGELFESPAVQAVRMLDRLSAPSVVDRLVEEELAAPRAAQTERVVGNLERRTAPKSLEPRVVEALRRRIRSSSLAGGLTALAAAVLVVWLGFFYPGTSVSDPDGPKQERPGGSYSFRVVRAGAGDPIDPWIESMGQNLTGGALAARSLPPRGEGGGG